MQADNELAKRLRILVVDDSRIVRIMVKKHLVDAYDVVEEENGETGWQRIVSDPDVSLVLSDLSMPELDGMGLLARIRGSQDARIRSLPVIIISGEEDEATRSRCVEHGASDFVTKSTDRAEMLARVRANIERSQSMAALTTAQQSATVDSSTGTGSSHLLMLQTEQALAFAQRHSGEVALLLLEIDHADALATRLGDKVLEQMLALLAKHLAAKLRREDTLAHVAGPRFAVVSPGSSVEECKVLAERLRQTISSAKVSFRGEQLQVTTSVAVSNSRVDQTASAAELIVAAETRLTARGAGNAIILPTLVAPTPAPSVQEALEMLHCGLEGDVRAHLPELLERLKPLLVLANQELGLGARLDQIK
ncbi:response regulator [Chitinibacteraceae bacterium HSL-7]